MCLVRCKDPPKIIHQPKKCAMVAYFYATIAHFFGVREISSETCRQKSKTMSKSKKRIVITSNALNAYGTRVLTEGMDIEQFRRNPVLLYMHDRGTVIGMLDDITIEEDKISGVPRFDEATELSIRVKKQWEFGSIRMSSVGIDIIEWSDDKKYLVQGQTRPTITKSKLVEVSMVDIGANDEALVLYKDGNRLTLSKDGDCDLPLLKTEQPNNNPKTEKKMDEKKLALMLGLPETATSEQIEAALTAQKAQNEALKQQAEALALAGITTAVENAIAQRRLSASKKDEFIELGKQMGLEALGKVLEAMNPATKLSETLNHKDGTTAPTTYSKLSEVPADKLMDMRTNNREEYKKLYEAEFGIPCVIQD